MKKQYYLFLFILFLMPHTSFAGEQSTGRIALRGSLSSDQSVRTLIDPIVVIQNQYTLNVQVSINNNLKIKIVDSHGFLIYERELINCRGQEIVIPISDWDIGSYEIIITNKDMEKSATGNLYLYP